MGNVCWPDVPREKNVPVVQNVSPLLEESATALVPRVTLPRLMALAKVYIKIFILLRPINFIYIINITETNDAITFTYRYKRVYRWTPSMWLRSRVRKPARISSVRLSTRLWRRPIQRSVFSGSEKMHKRQRV